MIHEVIARVAHAGRRAETGAEAATRILGEMQSVRERTQSSLMKAYNLRRVYDDQVGRIDETWSKTLQLAGAGDAASLDRLGGLDLLRYAKRQAREDLSTEIRGFEQKLQQMRVQQDALKALLLTG